VEKSLGDESVKAGDDDAKALSRSAEFAFQRFYLEVRTTVQRRNFFVVFLRGPVAPC